MTEPKTAFHRLAERPDPYLLGNVWDAPSARAATAAGFEALGTSSAAVSATLGRADGEGLAFDELRLFVRAIRGATDLPLSVDVEHGYGATDAQAAANVVALARLGPRASTSRTPSWRAARGGWWVRSVLPQGSRLSRMPSRRRGYRAS